MLKILAIDDNSDNLISLKAIIDDAFPGSIVFTALNGPRGIELAIANNPDVILLDIIMPGMDGFDVCRLLKLDEQVRDIPVVFLTALKGDKENRIKALEVGAEGFLSKPIDETELTVQIRAMVKIKTANEGKRNEKERLELLVEERTRELVRSQAQLKGIFENLQDAYLQTDLSGHLTIVSPSAVKIYGYQSPDELIGQSADKLYFDLNERNALLSMLSSAGNIKDFVCQGKKKDGSSFWISMNVQLLKSSDGQIFGTEGVVRDISERKKSEDILKESEERFRHISSSISDICYSCVNDPEGNSTINWLYGATEKITGYTIDELFAMKCWGKLVVEEDFPIFKSHILGALPGQSETCQLRLKRKDGNLVWIQATAECVKGPEGESFNILYGGLVDITERKNAEELLRESEEKYRFMVELLPDAVIIHEGGKFVFANAAALKTVGAQSFEQLAERPLMAYVHPDFRDDSLSRIKKIYSTGQPSRFSEEKFISLNDELIDVEVIGIPILYQGRPAIQAIIRDITERKKSEAALKESEERFKLIFEASNVAESITLPTGEIHVNQAFCDLFGYTAAELKGKRWQEVTFPDEVEIDQKLIDSILRGEMNAARRIKRYIHKSGRLIFGDVSYALIRDHDKKPLHFITTIIDITDQKRAEEAIRKSESMLRTLIESAPFEVWARDKDGFGILENENTIRHFGSILGKSIDQHDIPANITQHWSSNNKRVMQGEIINDECVYPVDGVERTFHQILAPIIVDGSIDGITGFNIDITERKQVEKAVLEREQLFQGLFNASPDAIVLIDPHHPTISWPIVDCNEASCRMNGYSREEMIGQSIDLLNGSKGTPEDRISYYDILRRDGIIHAEIAHLHKDGHIFPIETSSSIISIGGHEMVLGIDRDITERKQAEKALKESEDHYRSFISQVSEGVYRFECDQPIDISLPVEDQVDFIYDQMFIAECNDSFLKIYGIKDRSEMIGKGYLFFHGGRYHPLNRESLVAFVKNGYRIENAMTEDRNQQGQMTYISHNSLGIIENNQLVRIWGTLIDITEQIHADRVQQVLYTISNATLTSNDLHELIEIISNELGRLLDSTNFFIAFYDESTEMLSTAFEKGDRDKIDTWPAEKSLTGYVIKHQKSVLANEADIKKLCETGEIEIVGLASKIWMGVPLSVNKKVIGAIVVQSYDNPDAFTEKEKLMLEFVSHQISTSIERKKIEHELKLMGKAFDQSPVTIVITDKNGNIEYTNPKFSETTGYTPEEVKGKNPRVLQSGSQSIENYQELWKTILAGNDWFGEFQNKRKNGELYWESAVISPITNESGDIAFFMAIKEDITEKKKMISDLIQARNKAEESDRLKSAFLANMSHEIRTPLNSIIGFSELMTDPDFDAGTRTEFAEIIVNSGNSLLTIISDIMDFSKIEAGQISIRKNPLVLQKLISSLQNEYSFAAREKGIELRIDPLNPKDDIWIWSDENRLKQVLVNLVGNAIKFTKEGYVEIGIKKTGDCIQFQVSDTGIGIAKEYYDEVFERFRQVESANSRKYGGNGLGLAISKSLVEMMGGKIWLESVPGKGSTFYFTIPIGLTTT